jgi:hypothetical protein
VGVSTREGFRALLWEEVEEIAPGRWRTLTPAAPVVASVMEGVA